MLTKEGFKSFSFISPAAQLERWENALRVLKDMPVHKRKKHWDMSIFGDKTSCGTVACAAGHCGLDPWFRRQGFTLNFKPYFRMEWDDEKQKNVRKKLYADVIPDVRAFFGHTGANEIFFRARSRSVAHVIKEIKSYIKHLKEFGREAHFTNLHLN